jgi:hypothetical protein
MRTRAPREYLILRVTRILHADRRKLWRLRLKSLLVHRVVAAEARRAAPFHDPEGIMAEAYFRSGVR